MPLPHGRLEKEMKKFKIGLIRVLTSDDQEFVNTHGQFIEQKFPALEVESRCIPDQWEGIHSPELAELAIPKIVATAKNFKDIDMILVSCADDPGIEELREAFPGIPVTGGGETTAALASKYPGKVGVLGIVEYAPRAYERMLSDRIILAKPDGVDSTLDLMTPKGRESCLKAGQQLKDAGATVIVLGCTGLTTIGLAQELESKIGLPVIDPVLAQGVFACFEAARRI